jgi:hypothetical protein
MKKILFVAASMMFLTSFTYKQKPVSIKTSIPMCGMAYVGTNNCAL